MRTAGETDLCRQEDEQPAEGDQEMTHGHTATVLRGLLACLVLCAAAWSATSACARGVQEAWWRLASSCAPSTLKPGDKEDVVLAAVSNLGDAPGRHRLADHGHRPSPSGPDGQVHTADLLLRTTGRHMRTRARAALHVHTGRAAICPPGSEDHGRSCIGPAAAGVGQRTRSAGRRSARLVGDRGAEGRRRTDPVRRADG